MKKFKEFRVGDKFFSTCSISEDELDEYFRFSRVKNAFLEDYGSKKQQMVSGRAALSRMEGEFTLKKICCFYTNFAIESCLLGFNLLGAGETCWLSGFNFILVVLF